LRNSFLRKRYAEKEDHHEKRTGWSGGTQRARGGQQRGVKLKTNRGKKRPGSPPSQGRAKERALHERKDGVSREMYRKGGCEIRAFRTGKARSIIETGKEKWEASGPLKKISKGPVPGEKNSKSHRERKEKNLRRKSAGLFPRGDP